MLKLILFWNGEANNHSSEIRTITPVYLAPVLILIIMQECGVFIHYGVSVMTNAENSNETNAGFVDLSPSPSSLIESLRDIGYSLETAVADVIDNSITALSTSIDVRFSWNDSTPWLAIIDDGHGMNGAELISAMRFGSMSPLLTRSKNDLGRFGLGLKTASFSQCRCLTVLSKKQGEISCCQWDLDSILKSEDNKWLLRIWQQRSLSSLIY